MDYAAHKGNLDVVKYYLEHLTDKNPGQQCDDLFKGRTPLHKAAHNGQVAVVKLISEFLDDKNPPDANGITPMHLAVANGHLDVVKMITVGLKDKNPAASLYLRYYYYAGMPN